jgi:hypothetical protein
MKHFSQIIALSLFGLNAVQIIVAIATSFMLLQMLFNKFSVSRWWKARKENSEIENNMWAIE